MAVQQSLGEPAPFRVEGTEFAIVANMSTHENGNAGFSFLTANPHRKWVRAGGINHVFRCRCLPLANSPAGLAPHRSEIPSRGGNGPADAVLLCAKFHAKNDALATGFTTANSDALTKEERANLLTLVRLAAMILLQRCERACEEAAMAGTWQRRIQHAFPNCWTKKTEPALSRRSPFLGKRANPTTHQLRTSTYPLPP